MNGNSNKRISVIIPAYNVEKTIGKCLDSVIRQTYVNLEIIVVNDGSTDATGTLIDQYKEKDARIKVIQHANNQGLFLARMTGIKAASGDYIGFVDSDDYISLDYYRALLYEAEKTKADIVVGKLVQEDESGYQWINNIYDDYDFGLLSGKQVWEAYWKQEGQCFIWHTIWNKLYSAKIWKEALPILERQKEHLIMTEDFIFSSVIFYYAQRLSCAKYARYFYYRNSNASTALDNNPKKFEKNVRDLIQAFHFVKGFLRDIEAAETILHHYDRWESLYKFFWTQNIVKSSLEDRDKTGLLSVLNAAFQSNDIPRNPDYFYSVSTKYDDRYDKIVEWMLSDKIKVISFDIFDTALVRPFYRPEDLFDGLNNRFKTYCPSLPIKFSKLRVEAEKTLREERIYQCENPAEDVSLDEIYTKIAQLVPVSHKVLQKMKSAEISLEERFLHKRESIYNLYQIAVHIHKKVIFTSDMYLDGKTLQRILYRNGYDRIDGIYVSAEQGASKRTGTLYDRIIDELNVDGNNILHVGDSWESDVINARRYGIVTCFYPKTVECLAYGISDIKSTHALGGYKGKNNSLINFENSLKFIGNRCAIAIAANELYDMPFVSYNEWTEMNASPQFMGSFALGMHLLGVTKWFTDESEKRGYQKLIFISRDGYLPMQAYQIYHKYSNQGPKQMDYFYTSRKAAVPCGVTTVEDLYSLYDTLGTDVLLGRDIIELLMPLINEDRLSQVSDEKLQMEINSLEKYCIFVEQVLKNLFDAKKAADFNRSVSDYFNSVFKEKTALVDVGYSGRTQEMIFRTIGKAIDGFFIHKNEDECLKRENGYQFAVEAFYDFSPSITGAQRELVFSALSPSCIGYETSDGVVKPRFEEVMFDYPQFYLISEMQKAALQFVEDFCSNFADMPELTYMRNIEISYPFEHIMAYIEDADLKMFDCVLFEDDLWAGGTVSLSHQWKENIRYHRLLQNYKTRTEVKYVERIVEIPEQSKNYAWKLYHEKAMENKNIFAKMIFWLVNDRTFFRERWKSHTSGKKE